MNKSSILTTRINNLLSEKINYFFAGRGGKKEFGLSHPQKDPDHQGLIHTLYKHVSNSVDRGGAREFSLGKHKITHHYAGGGQISGNASAMRHLQDLHDKEV